MVRSGYFGFEDYFAPIMDSITTGGDVYLVANDFVPYINAQVSGGRGGKGRGGGRGGDERVDPLSCLPVDRWLHASSSSLVVMSTWHECMT